MTIRAALAITLLGALPSCTGRDADAPSDAGALRCSASVDCDDGAECTIDTCGVSGMCEYTAVDERCAGGESCVVGRGCVAGTSCASTADCDDSVACTIDSCVVGGTCEHMPVHERCDAATPVCDPVSGCSTAPGCGSHVECDDSIACTVDTCGADRMCDHMPLAERCGAGEMCSLSMGCYVPRPCTTASECDDGVFCNGVERCVPEFGCADAETSRMCDDSDDCTIDTCDATADRCVFACDASRVECGCAPSGECSGRFTLTGSTMHVCPGDPLFCPGGATLDFSEATFTNDGVSISVRPLRYGTFTGTTFMEIPLELTDLEEPVCPSFDASATVGGGCEEHYRIVGTFTDADHFMGRVERSYVATPGPIDQCMVCGCTNGGGDVVGTRAP